MKNRFTMTASLFLAGLMLATTPTLAGPEALMDPTALNETAPDQFRVKFETSKGDFYVDVTRDWAPLGADRFYNLVVSGFYDDIRVFRVVPNFVAQFGMNGNPDVQKAWQDASITDEPVKESNKKGTLTFAKRNIPNSRTTQIFINLRDNASLDGMGFSPFGTVTEGMDVVEALYSGYGDRGPNQGRIMAEGNAYMDASFPKLDKIVKATIVEGGGEGN